MSKSSNPGKKYLNVEEAAAYLGVSKSWLYNMWQRGDGPPRSKIAGRTLVSIEALEGWVRSREMKPDAA